MTFAAKLDDITATEMTPADHENGLAMLLKLRPPHQALTGEARPYVIDEEKVSLPIAETARIHRFEA